MKKCLKIIAATMLTLLAMFCLVGCNDATDLVYKDWAFESLKTENSKRATDTDVRVMSANILVHMSGWGGTPVKPRAQMFAEVLQHYKPDVVGLQEVCNDWYKYLTPQIADTYQFLYPDYNFFKENRTPIIYNKNKLELMDSGFHKYTSATKNYCRVVTWGVFKNKESSKIFAVTTTHWDFGMEAKNVVMRNTQISELTSIINNIKTTYNCPIFITGDFNSSERNMADGAESYSKFITECDVVDTKFSEDIAKNCGSGAKYEDESPDHIFLKGAARVLSFNILANGFYAEMSDHFPIYIDAQI